MPFKFLAIICNVFLLLVCAFHRDANIAAGTGDDASQSDVDTAKSSIQACVALGVVLQLLELLLLVLGFTLFFNQITVMRKLHAEILLHTFGVVFLSWYVLEEWNYNLLWAIWSFVAFLPLFLDVFTLLTHRFLLKPTKSR